MKGKKLFELIPRRKSWGRRQCNQRIAEWQFNEDLFRYRWILGFCIIGLCTVFHISGSSIGMWGQILPQANQYISLSTENEVDDGVLFGTPRVIRSDEWATFTPMAFSQTVGKDSFSYFGTTVRADETDMYIIYGQPVASPLIIYRPFQIGYLLFGRDGGLAFFWSSRLVFLFLVSLDFFLMITDNKRLYSILGAVLITFSPVVSWWFFINGLVEMLVFSMGAALALRRFIQVNKLLRKAIDTVLLVICTGGFILTSYPSWEVPMAYVTAFLMLWVLLASNSVIKELPRGNSLTSKKRKLFNRTDLLLISGYVLILGASLLAVYLNSSDTIDVVLHTAYQGNSLETGGGMALSLFRSPGSLFYPWMESDFSGTSNVCEMAGFIDLFPLGLILGGYCLVRSIKKKKPDRFLICMFLPFFILLAWLCFSWPEFLAKVSLLSMSQPSRTYIVVGLLNIFLLIYSLAKITLWHEEKVQAGQQEKVQMQKNDKKWLGVQKNELSHNQTKLQPEEQEKAQQNEKKPFSGKWIPWLKLLVSIGMAGLMVLGAKEANMDYLTTKKVWFLLVLFSLFTGLALFSAKRKWIRGCFVLLLSLTVFLTGFHVNPIQKGTDVIYDHPLLRIIRQVDRDIPGNWVVENLSMLYHNIPIMVGAATINSTNTYPDMDRWRLLDPEGKYEFQYNRYAHISIRLDDTVTKPVFDLEAADHMVIYLNADDLVTIGTDYILTDRDLSGYSTEHTRLTKIRELFGYQVYMVATNA